MTPLGLADRPVRAERNGLIVYGQSLATGSAALPPVSILQPYNNLTFGAGPRATKAGNAFGGGNFGTDTEKPLVEDTASPFSDTNLGETICSSAANTAVRYAGDENGISPSDFVIFASAPGRSGYHCIQLSKGAPWYQNLLDHVSEAAALADTKGANYALHAVAWLQGESDTATPRDLYRTQLLQLEEDVNRDVIALTGQQSPVHLLLYQTVYEIAAAPAVAMAQLDAVRQNSRIHFVSPIYHLPFADAVHLTNIGEFRYGCAVGRAYKQLVIDGCVPDCLWPIEARLDNDAVMVRLRVPCPPLVVDETELAKTVDCGFQVVDDAGAIAIRQIAVAGQDAISIALSRPARANVRVRYGLDHIGAGVTIQGGASGNLRDSTLDQCTILHHDFALWHVAPAFEMPVLSA